MLAHLSLPDEREDAVEASVEFAAAVEEQGAATQDIARDVMGLGPLEQFLNDPTVNEIMVNGSNYIYVEGPLDYVLHFASPASPIDYLKHPIETLETGSTATRGRCRSTTWDIRCARRRSHSSSPSRRSSARTRSATTTTRSPGRR